MELGGEVEHGAGRRGDPEAVVDADVGVAELPDAMQADALARSAASPDDRDVDWSVVVVPQAPSRRGRRVAEHGTRAVREHGGEPASGRGQRHVTHRVDTSIKGPQPLSPAAPADRHAREAGLQELRLGHDPELSVGHGREAQFSVLNVALDPFRESAVTVCPRRVHFVVVAFAERPSVTLWTARRTGHGPSVRPRTADPAN
jgi:hypothetical protein